MEMMVGSPDAKDTRVCEVVGASESRPLSYTRLIRVLSRVGVISDV